jgi:hypothetical protein
MTLKALIPLPALVMMAAALMLPVPAAHAVPITVATPTLVPSGAQQWMCAATVFEVKPLNVTLSCSVWAIGSSTTVAKPVPAGLTGGTSFAPEKVHFENLARRGMSRQVIPAAAKGKSHDWVSLRFRN